MSYLNLMSAPKKTKQILLADAKHAQAFSGFLQRILDRLGWTQQEVEDRSGPERNVVGRHLRAEIYPRRDTRVKYAEAFQMSPDAFEREVQAAIRSVEQNDSAAMDRAVTTVVNALQLGGDGLPQGSPHDPFSLPPQARASWIPQLGAVAAGKPSDFELNVLGDKDLPPSLYHAPGEHPATIIAHGDSMSPMIADGDIVVIARRFWRQPKTGDVVAVSLVQENGHTIKWLEVLGDGRLLLKPRNENHPIRTVSPEEVKAMAVVVGFYHPLHRPRVNAAKGDGPRR